MFEFVFVDFCDVCVYEFVDWYWWFVDVYSYFFDICCGVLVEGVMFVGCCVFMGR